jgi:hypothetical protein
MNRLEEIEAIKQLKYRYLRALDTNDWKLMAECLAENCQSWYGGGKYSFSGRDPIIRFLDEHMSGDQFLSVHQVHHPEIELTSEATAKGVWYLTDVVLDLKRGLDLFGAAFYEDEYVKRDGRWWIQRTGYRRTFEQWQPRRPEQQITENMFRKGAP